MQANRNNIKTLIIILINIAFATPHSEAQEPNIEKPIKEYSSGLNLRYTYPDSALQLFTASYNSFLLKGDTIRTIKSLIEMGTIHSSKANYSKAYDDYWEAQILAQNISDSTLTGRIYDGIALLYSLFGRHEKVEEYFRKSLEFKKKMVEAGKIEPTTFVSSYYLMVLYNRDIGNFSLAQNYLDSCKITRNNAGYSEADAPYLDAEQAYLTYHLGNPEKALKEMLLLEQKFMTINKSYLVILYTLWADMYMSVNELNKSESYYLKALDIADQYKSHQNFIPKVYEKLSKLYLKTNKLLIAYQYLEKSKTLDNSLFGARSQNNNRFLEIKDDFRLEQEKQRKLLEKTRLIELEQEKHIWFLKNIILTVSLVLVALLAIVVFWYLKNRHKTEQKILKHNQSLNEQKNKEILEIKNKELTSSALQLIQKDELLLEIKNKLQKAKRGEEQLNPASILGKINSNSKQDWKEFNVRFTSVNENFYETLREKIPSLTQNEQKLCALIKLNFSSKEMASLLGISIESVHTSRYRLRKKLQLDKGDSLGEFIAKI